MKKIVIAAALAATALLGGCSAAGDQPTQSSSPATSGSPTGSISPSTSASTSSRSGSDVTPKQLVGTWLNYANDALRLEPQGICRYAKTEAGLDTGQPCVWSFSPEEGTAGRYGSLVVSGIEDRALLGWVTRAEGGGLVISLPEQGEFKGTTAFVQQG